MKPTQDLSVLGFSFFGFLARADPINPKGSKRLQVLYTAKPLQNNRLDRWLSVYDGADHVGFIEEGRNGFRAYDPAGKLIGTYKTQREATRAIPKVAP